MAASRFLALTCVTITVLLAIVGTSLAEQKLITSTTKFVNRWHGGFIAVVDIPIDDVNIDGWSMTITFPKNIFEFEICGAEVVETEENRKEVIHLRNHDWNAKLSDGDSLYFTFNAKTWKKIRGLTGEVQFSGTIDSAVPTVTPEPESSDDGSSSAMGYDNGLEVCTTGAANSVDLNNTCGSSFQTISTNGVSIGEVQVNVDFSTTEETHVRIIATEVLAWFAIDSTFQPILTLGDGTVKEVTASVSVVSTQERQLNIDISASDLDDIAGRITVRFRYPVATAVLFPYMEGGDAVCPCKRLNIIASPGSS